MLHINFRFSFTVKENFKPIRIMALTLKSSNGIHLKVSERIPGK